MTAILKVDTIQDTSGNNIINENANTVTIGKAGDTVNVVGTLQNNSSALISGITMAQQWRLTANFAGDANPIASNWEVADTNSPGTIGSTMSESSGVFTFPSTGIYFIAFQVAARFNSAGGYHTAAIQVTTNNSSYSTASAGDAAGATSAYQSVTINYILDVTDTSNVKVRFGIDAVGASQDTLGNTGQNQTAVTFVRLGDT